MCLVLLKYNVATYQYTEGQDLRIDKYCNSFLVHNTGTTNIYASGDLIIPGGSKTYGGNYGEIFVGPMEIIFRVPVPAPGTITNQATITQKFYTNIDELQSRQHKF